MELRLFTVREQTLSDGSQVFDVLANGQEFYNAQNEKDAYEFLDDLRTLIRRYEGETAKIRAQAAGVLWKRMNALSYAFGYDTYGARTLTEAADALKPKA